MPTRDLSTKQSGTQQSISRFFSSEKPSASASGKRARSPVDLTFDSDDEPAAKRVKTLTQATPSAHSEHDGSKPESPLKKKYKFVTTDDSSPPAPDAETRQKQAERRRIWKETLKQTNKDSSPPIESQDEVPDLTGGNTDEEEPEEPVSKLQERFALKMSVAKSNGASKSKKKNEEIGPSGQPYTPLELQASHSLHRYLS
jgi:DNA mismatch repair protein MSH3